MSQGIGGVGMTIYVDLLFFINWIINYLLLAATCAMAGEEMARGRLLLGSAVGALYSAFMFFPQVSFLFWGGVRLVMSAALVYLSFRHRNVIGFLKMLFYFYIVSFIFGGGMYLFYAFTSAGANMLYSNGVYYVDIPLWVLLLLAFGFYGVIRLVGRLQVLTRHSAARRKTLIRLDGKEVILWGFVDSGNALYDPVTLLPVMVAEVQGFKGVLPEEILRAVRGGEVAALEQIVRRYPQFKCRLIPCRGVANSSRLLLAVKPTQVKLDGKISRETLLAFTGQNLCADGSYQVLLHATQE